MGRTDRQRFEQYLTSAQTFAHFLRQAKGRPQVAQVLDGKSALRFMHVHSVERAGFQHLRSIHFGL